MSARFTPAAAALALVLSVPLCASAEDRPVNLEAGDGEIHVSIGDEPLAVYRHGKDLPKPFFIDVRSEGGAIVTRSLENPEDHPHHKGIWLAIDEVSGVRFWAEQGKIENQKAEIVHSGANPAVLKATNHWLASDGQPLLVETTTVSIDSRRLFAFDIVLRPYKEAVVFEDTKEGLFGLRLCNSLREKEGGTVVNADGLMGTKECWGKPSAWVDYVGQVDGRTHGVALMDHPENPRVSRYHVRDYGLFTINPFGVHAYTGGAEEAQPLKLEPESEFRLRYAIYVHPGDTQSAQVDDVYQSWIESAR